MVRPVTAADHGLHVLGIRVTIHTMGYVFEGDTRSANHASIYLLTSGNKSVRLNMIKAGPTDTMGTFEMSYCDYFSSHSSVGDFDLPIRQGITVGAIIALVYNKGRHRYRLARSGVGCRFWVATVITDLEENQFLHPSNSSNAASARQFLQYNYTLGGTPEFEPMVPGKFV